MAWWDKHGGSDSPFDVRHRNQPRRSQRVSISIAVPDITTFQLLGNGSIKLSPGTGSFTFASGVMESDWNTSGITLYSTTDATGLALGTQRAVLPTSAYIYTPQGGGARRAEAPAGRRRVPVQRLGRPDRGTRHG